MHEAEWTAKELKYVTLGHNSLSFAPKEPVRENNLPNKYFPKSQTLLYAQN